MNEIDFLPESIRRQRRARQRTRQHALTLGLFASILVLLAYWNEGRITSAEATLASQQSRREGLDVQLGMIPSLQAQQADGKVKVRISKELGSRLPVNAVLAELARRLPKAASLIEFDFSTVEIRRTGAAGRGARRGRRVKAPPPEKRIKLHLKGIAATGMDVANFVDQLSSCPLFTEVTMHHDKPMTIDENRRKARSFEVSCWLVQ